MANNPYAEVWADAERRLNFHIAAIHELGSRVDASRHNLHWQGGAEQRFQTRAAARHDSLHQHNDALRYLLALVRVAATVKPKVAP